MPKVLITGMAGFLGSHVAELFAKEGWQVAGIDNLTKFELARTGYNVDKARDYNVKFLAGIGAELIVEDIRNRSAVQAAAKGCDYIINCAAQPAMTVALEKPGYDADTNIMGVLSVLDAARKWEIPAALCSTIHVYGNGVNDCLNTTPDGFRPKADHCLTFLSGKITPLHISKYVNELYARAYTESYGLPVFTARLTGIYGPRQFGGEDHGWVANFAIRTLLGLPITVFGTDMQVRDILYVEDAARAFLDWYNKPVPGVYNIGGGKPCRTSIRSCLENLCLITGKRQEVTWKPARPGDLWYFCCDTSKAKDTFGWKAQTLPAQGLPKLVKWIEQNKGIFAGAEALCRQS